MTSTRPVISVIIPHLNQPDSLECCLSSLDSQSLDRSLFEVIVVDNGSFSLPTGAVRCHPGTQLLQELQPGPGLARNRGIEAARGEFLAFIDADCRAHMDWLRNALRNMISGPARTILGGDVQIWRESKAEITALEAYESVFAYRFKLYIEKHGFSGTGNLVVRRSEFGCIGPFGGIEIAEDIDWGKRARSAGYTFVYVPDMIVFHPARRSLQELYIKWDRHIQHAVNTLGSGPICKARWVARACAVFLSPALDWIKIASSERISGISARTKALLILVMIRAYRAYRMIHLLLSDRAVSWNRDLVVPAREVRQDPVQHT